MIATVPRSGSWLLADALERTGLCGSPREYLREDAPVLPAVHVAPLARLSRPTSSDDPRAQTSSSLPGLRDLAAELSAAAVLRMPPLRVR